MRIYVILTKRTPARVVSPARAITDGVMIMLQPQTVYSARLRWLNGKFWVEVDFRNARFEVRDFWRVKDMRHVVMSQADNFPIGFWRRG